MRLGIDLGGTNIAYGVVTDDGKMVRSEQEALTSVLFSDVVAVICQIYQTFSTIYDLKVVGLGVPGIVADARGDDVTCVNLAWHNVALYSALKRHIKCRLAIANDANCACLGEFLFGSLTGQSNAALLTLGTGVGSGLIVNGQLLSGRNGAAELGHMIIADDGWRCNCGNTGCLETFASAGALKRYYNYLSDRSVSSAEQVFECFRQSDQAAIETVNWFCEHLAVAIVNLYNTFAPTVISLSGGVSKSFDDFSGPLVTAVARRRLHKNMPYGKIVRATLNEQSAVSGAAFLLDYKELLC